MGGYSLPALAIDPQKYAPDTLGDAGQVMKLKELMQTQPTRIAQGQENLKSTQLGNQNAQMELQDKAALTKAWSMIGQPKPVKTTGADGQPVAPDANTPAAAPSVYDYDDVPELVAKNGGSGTTALALRKQILAYKTEQLGNDKSKQELQVKAHEEMGNILGALTTVTDPAQLPAAAAAAQAQILALPGLDDSSRKAIATLPIQNVTPEMVKQFYAQNTAHTQFLKNTAEQQQADEAGSRAGLTTTETFDKKRVSAATLFQGTKNQADWDRAVNTAKAQKIPQELLDQIGATWSPEAVERAKQLGITPEQVQQQPETKISREDWLKQHPFKIVNGQKVPNGPSDYALAMRELVPILTNRLQGGVGVDTPAANKISNAEKQGLTGGAFIATLPARIQARVWATIQGRADMPSGAALRDPENKLVADSVYTAEPNWSPQRAAARKAFASGQKEGVNVQNLNTASIHLDALGEAAKGLSQGTFTPGNAAYNAISKVLGGTAPTDFNGIRTAVAGEMANALKGSATDPEIASIKESILAANSPEQMAGIVNTHLTTLHQKLQEKKEQLYKDLGIPEGEEDVITKDFVLPSARKVFQKHGIESGNGGPAAAPASKSGAQGKEKPVYNNGKLVGYSDNGKTITRLP